MKCTPGFLCLVLFCLTNSDFISARRSSYSSHSSEEDDEPHDSGYSYEFYHREQVIDPKIIVNDPSGEKGGNFLCMYFGLCTINNFAQGQRSEFVTKYEWKQMEWDWPSEAERNAAIAAGTYIPGSGLPIDVDVYYGPNGKNKIFVITPRAGPGIPASVNVVTQKMRDGNPLVAPYPDWSWFKNPEQCPQNRIVGAYRVQIDECGRLWILDTGRIMDQNICPPQILAFDLATNKLVHKHEIPWSLLERERSILVTPIVDNRDSRCSNTFVYVADCQTYSIIVHDVKNAVSWKATDKSMYPYPNYGTFDIQGEQFELMDGVLGMALEPSRQGQDRKLFFHSLSSPTENWVYTSFLRNRTRFEDNPWSSPEIFNTYKGTRPSQCAAEAFDKNGVQFFGLAHETSINCWNSDTEYGGKNIDAIEQNANTLQFNSGMKVINNPKGEQELWFITNRIQKIYTGSITSNEVNFRMLAGRTEDLLAHTKCKSRGHGSGGNRPGRPSGGYGYNKRVRRQHMRYHY